MISGSNLLSTKNKEFYRIVNKHLIWAPLLVSMTLPSYASEWVDLRNTANTLVGGDQIQSVSDLENATSSVMNLEKRWVNQRGVEFARWTQVYKGIPVYGETLMTRDGVDNEFSATGFALMGLTDDVASMQTNITGEQALAVVQTRNNNPQSNQYVNLVVDTSSINTQLVIYRGTADDAITEGETIKAWSVSYFADLVGGGDPRRIFGLVDARDGTLIKEPINALDRVKQASGPGGNQKIGTYTYGVQQPTLTLDDNCRFETTNVRTVNLNGGTTGSTPYQINCNTTTPTNNFKTINGASSPINDAHYFGSVIYDMYNQYVGVNPLNIQLQMRVHYGQNYENAFWDGRTMSFGDGANFFYPLVSIDVAAHEVSHGFTEQNSNLVYANQSGGINEAFSDMAGEAAKFFVRGSTDFLVGADITKQTTALRYMQNPALDGASINDASQYTAGLDVHLSSGVYNKAFYTLATTPGWDVPTAFNVFAQANMAYWTPNITFDQGACGVLDATLDLGLSEQAVATAFATVGVSCPGRVIGDTGGNQPSTTTTLQSGVTVNAISGAGNDASFYALDVPAGTGNITFTMAGGTGDADLYVRRNALPTSAVYDARPYLDGNNETVSINNPTAGTYYAMIRGFAAFNNVSLTGTVQDGNNPASTTFQSTGAVDIPDANSAGAFSPINVGLADNAGAVSVNIDISHTWSGDLVISLVEPGGGSVVLDSLDPNNSADNISKTYSVSAAGVTSLGMWQLKVQDLANQDTGTINSWSVTFNPNAAVTTNDLTATGNSNLALYNTNKNLTGGGSSGSSSNASVSGGGGGGGNAAFSLSILLTISGLIAGIRRRKST